MQADEYGIESEVTVLRQAPIEMYSKEDQYVPPILAKWLRPHQREGVEFLYQCVMGMKNYNGHGAILADDMGLGEFIETCRGIPIVKRRVDGLISLYHPILF